MFEEPWIKAWDLNGKDVTVCIRGVESGKIGHGKQASKKPVLSFEKTKKTLAINKTIGKTILTMYGPRTEDWIGKLITLYPTTTDFGGQEVDCIRVRPRIPQGKAPVGIEHRPGGEEQQERKDAAAGRVAGDEGEQAPSDAPAEPPMREIGEEG